MAEAFRSGLETVAAIQTESALKVFEEHGFSPYTADAEESAAEDTQTDQKTDS